MTFYGPIKFASVGLGFMTGGVAQRSCASVAQCEEHTQPRFDFCGKPATFTPIYTADASQNIASVNAGSYKLYVGGGGINRGFQAALKLADENGFEALHQQMFEKANASPGKLVGSGAGKPAPGEDLGLAGCFARVARPLADTVGVALIDLFAPAARPLSSSNVAMLYVVGPNGKTQDGRPGITDRNAFLDAVGDMAANAITAVYEYNQMAAAATPPLPKIEVVQWCLVSGAIFKHPDTSKFDVALATVKGMLGCAQTFTAGAQHVPLIRFAYDENAFEDAVAHALQQ